jgi:hypothetical protein
MTANAACLSGPPPLTPIGPTVQVEFKDEFPRQNDIFVRLTAWRYPCTSPSSPPSYVILTVEPVTRDPEVCSIHTPQDWGTPERPKITLIQQGVTDEHITLTQFPEDNPPPLYCQEVISKTSIAILNDGHATHPTDLQGGFVIDFEIDTDVLNYFRNVQLNMFAYDPNDYGLGNPPPSPTNDLTNDAGISGLFYDPNTSGHGFNFNKGSAGLTIFYYGHTRTGERLWLISDTLKANLDYDTLIRLKMYEVLQGTFGDPELNLTDWGSLYLIINDCNSVTAELNGLDGYFSADLVRLDDIEGVGCQ